MTVKVVYLPLFTTNIKYFKSNLMLKY